MTKYEANLEHLAWQAEQHTLNQAVEDGWTIVTPYHWTKRVNGHELDYWPTNCKVKYRTKKYQISGHIDKFIKRIENDRV